MSNKMIMGLAAGLIALTALQAPAAEAKGKGWHKFNDNHKHHVMKWHKWHAPYHYVHFNDCGHYFWKWKHTGNFFWKTKYFACKGIY